MSAFQILDQNLKPIPLATLDIEVCQIWEHDIHKTKYASNTCGNWFDVIGFQIATQKMFHDHGLNTWPTIKQNIFNVHSHNLATMTPEQAGVSCCRIMRMLQPYFDVIDVWSEKGYIPLKYN